jgi:uncharacterized membrane protein YheB (UPF0754 family)
MPVILSTLVILLAALGCWLLSVLFIRILFRPYSPKDFIGFRLHGIVPALLPRIAEYAGNMVQTELLSQDKIAAKLSDPALMDALRPEIESHIDQFLQTKLKEAFPLLSNFMGEKTLGKFRSAFLTEVETILPELLKNHSGRLIGQFNPEQLLAEKLNSSRISEMEAMVHQHAGRQIKLFQLAAALLGLLLGIIQVLIIHLY